MTALAALTLMASGCVHKAPVAVMESDPATPRPTSSATGNTAKDNTIIIGMVTSLNGDMKPGGDDSAKGAQMALEEFNKENPNGIGGKKIDLRVSDSNSRPEQGKSAAEKLISDGAIGLIGDVSSGICAQIANAAYEKGVPVVAVGATRGDLTDIGSNVFRVCYTDDFQGPVMALFAIKELSKKKAAIITDQKQPYSTGLSKSFRAFFTKLGGTVVDEEFYNSGDTQFSGQLTNLKAKSPDVIFMSGYFNETGPLARQAREQGIGKDVPLLGGDGWDSRELLTTGGDAIVGGFFCNHYNNQEARPEVQKFLKAWTAKYGAAPGTTMAALGYDATMLTLQAVKAAKSADSKDLTEAIDNTTNFKGVSGNITLKGMDGNPRQRALVVQVTGDPSAPEKFVKAYEWTDVFEAPFHQHHRYMLSDFN
jgi:branched-chain amino acid transport system substrate-binding protein